MKEIKFYRTYSYAADGKSVEKRGFETIELAKQDAYNDMKESNFYLYEVNITFNGTVIEKEKYVGKLVSGRDLAVFAPKTETKTR